jgi:GNAT superfamily N-acetyltransferase
VVGFLIAEILDGVPHIEEIDVALDAGQRGHGTRLLEACIEWATRMGATAITLTTFRDVPWNLPWYERQGFQVLAVDDLGPELAARRDDEHARGLLAELRVAMRRTL